MSTDCRSVRELIAELDRLIGERLRRTSEEPPPAYSMGFWGRYAFHRPEGEGAEEAALWDLLWRLLAEPARLGELPDLDSPHGAGEYAVVLLSMNYGPGGVGRGPLPADLPRPADPEAARPPFGERCMRP